MKLRKLILISFLSLHIVAAHAGVPATTPVQQRLSPWKKPLRWPACKV